jgi:hypothetical protein
MKIPINKWFNGILLWLRAETSFRFMIQNLILGFVFIRIIMRVFQGNLCIIFLYKKSRRIYHVRINNRNLNFETGLILICSTRVL